MVTIMGAILLICASSMLGIKKSGELKEKAEALGSVISGLEMLKGEICTLQSPMPEVAARLSQSGPMEMRSFFSRLNTELYRLGEKSFYELWSNAVKQSRELCLGRDEENTLIHLGLSLGRYVLSEQEAVIDQCIHRFQDYYEHAKQKAMVQGRLYTGLGIAAGLMISIILL